MLEVFSGFVATIAVVAVGAAGYIQSRRFVSKRLRFVDQAQGPAVPLIAGGAALLLAIPIVAVLPFVGTGTAIVFGIAVAAGTRSGVKSFGRSLYP